MRIVVLGAGEIGAAVARQLAAADVVSHIVLVDDAGLVAAGKALDIAQAAPVDGYRTIVSGTSDETVVTGAAVVVVADRHGTPSQEWSGEDGVALIGRVGRRCGAAPLVCAGASQSTLIARGVHELGIGDTRLFGSAPEALRAALVSLVALEAEVSPADVSLIVVGQPPGGCIVPWDAVGLNGRRALDLLSPPVLTRLESRLPRLWPPGAMTLGAAAARIVASMVTRAPGRHLVHAVAGVARRGRAPVMLPARLGPAGLAAVEIPALSPRDRVRLETVLAG